MITSNKQIIRDTILDMERPFLLSDLFDRLGKMGIKDRSFILTILDELVDEGLVLYSEILNDSWAYTSIFTKTAC